MIKKIIIGVIVTAITVTAIVTVSGHLHRWSFGEYMEGAQRSLTMKLDDWRIIVTEIEETNRWRDRLVPDSYSIQMAVVDVPNRPYILGGLSDIGKRSLIPLVEYMVQFGNNELQEATDTQRVSYAMVFYDLLDNLHTLWSLEVEYDYGGLKAAGYLEGINQCKYLSITPSGYLEIEDMILDDGSVKDFDCDEWMNSRGWLD